MNANPSGSRTPSTGSRGGSEARREVAAVAVPSPGHARAAGRAGNSRGEPGEKRLAQRRDAPRHDGASRGPRCEARRPRKGRGPRSSPAHRPSSRATSASFGEHVRTGGRGPSMSFRSGQSSLGEAGRGPGARLAQSGPTRKSVTRLVSRRVTPSWSTPATTSLSTSACEQSRGKGVLAA